MEARVLMVSTVILVYVQEDFPVPTVTHNFLNATKSHVKMEEHVRMCPLMGDTIVAIVLMDGREVIANR